MKNIVTNVIATALLVVAATQGLRAQDSSTTARDSVPVLGAVSVTATRSPSPVLTTPLAVSTVRAAELRTMTGYGLNEALSRVPGVIANSRYGTSDIQLMIRGFGARGAGDRSNAGTSRGVRVLIDGFPETEPDGRTAMDHVDLNMASSVEVVRSNASAVWGNAAGGIVNVITVPTVERAGVETRALSGSFGLARYTLRAAAPLSNGAAYATFTNTSFDGWRAHSASERSLLNMGIASTLGASTDIGIFAVATNSLLHMPGPLTKTQLDADPSQANPTYVTRDERRHNRMGRLGITVTHRFDSTTSIGSSVFVNPKVQQRSERNTFRDFTRYHVGASVVGRTAFTTGSVRSHLTFGADDAYQDGAILFYDLTPSGGRAGTLRDDKAEALNNVGVFLQDELQVSDRLRLLAGARVDQVRYAFQSFMPAPPVRSDTRTFTQVSPKLGASYLVNATHSVYANVGRGLEVPAANESDPTPGSPPALLNPLHDPIVSTSYEIGFKSSGAPVLHTGIVAGYDIAAYDIEVENDAIPYNAGRYYLTAGRGRRTGIEIGVNAMTAGGVFGNAAVTLSRNRYLEYVVDSSVIFPGDTARDGIADYSGHQTVGLPGITMRAELGTEVPGFHALRISGQVEHGGRYFADDANSVAVPSYTIMNVTAALQQPIANLHGWAVHGFVTVHNIANTHYVGASFLNPDIVGGEAAAYEPGLPRTVTVSVSLGRL